MKMQFSEKFTENVRNWRYIKIVTTEGRGNYLISPIVLAIGIKKFQIHMYKSVYLGMSTLELSKIVMYDSWYDYVKPNIEKKWNWGCRQFHFIHKNKCYL